MRTFSEACQCALLYAWLGSIRPVANNTPVSNQYMRNAGAGGDEALLMLLQRLGDESGHKELKNAPLLFWGWSATASFGTTFAELHPNRTVAFIRYHTHRRDAPTNFDVLRPIPALIIAGEKDKTAGVEDAEAFWKSGRRLGAPWTFAIEAGAEHGSSYERLVKTIEDLLIPWMSAVLRDRLTPNTNTLRPILDNAAHLGDRQTGETAPYAEFPGMKADASWLPDQTTAWGWRNIANSGK